MYHEPVMLEAAIEGLSIKPGGTYVDATFGGGGHSGEILRRLVGGRLFAFDQDKRAEENVPADPRISFLNANFRFVKNFLRMYDGLPIDGIIADLGVSSHQFDEAERGFSTRFSGPLDMRMDQASGFTARDIVNEYDKAKLTELFYTYGELKRTGRIAGAIEAHRRNAAIETTDQLKAALAPLAPRGKENKFFAQVFQALRIEVNQELESLKELLFQCPDILKTGGRLVVISYHSLEDRLVKNFIKAGNFRGEVEKDFYGNPVKPLSAVEKSQPASEEEIKNNPRARSARLRIAEKQ
jgi:16S rRNA (cytosine1402-N4)-methyltransferase